MTISWLGLTPDRNQESGYGSNTLTIASTIKNRVSSEGNRRPFWVQIQKEELDVPAEDLSKRETRLFGKDDLALASTFFDCYRVSMETLSPDDLAKLGARFPVFQVYSPEGALLSSLSGANGPEALQSQLARACKEVYGQEMAPLVRRLHAKLDEVEKCEDKVAQINLRIADLEKRLAKNDKENTRKSLEESRAEAVIANQGLEAAKLAYRELAAAPKATNRERSD